MRLYSGSSNQFIQDTIQNQIAEKLRSAFFSYYRYNPPEGEVRAWKSSLRAVKDVFQTGGLLDNGVIVEYQLPQTSRRLDLLICGEDRTSSEQAVIIELKQWDKCIEADGENEVCTFVGGGMREVLHPSAQVGQYKLYLQDMQSVFYEGNPPVSLSSCSYLHNYNYYDEDVLFRPKFEQILIDSPLFTADDTTKFSEFLRSRLECGNGLEVLRKIEESKFRPSKFLMQHVSNVIKGNSDYVLLDEQKVVYDKVLTVARSGFHDKQKSVLIVKGGAGTGKSVIALNLVADLLAKGYNTHYSTGSKAFTQTLCQLIGRRGSVQFKYFNSYTDAGPNEIDVLICDEAHRIRESSNSQYTRKDERSNLYQIEEILRASKVSVFFIDDNQVVRPKEVGSVEYIKDFAGRYNCRLHEYELEAQFRCSGSEAFVNWINNTLVMKRTANILWDLTDRFEFKIFDSPEALEKAVVAKQEEGQKARMVAGFCWKWSDPDENGRLVKDIQISPFRRPWNAKPKDQRRENKYVKLADGVPEAPLWANDPKGLGQVGCIYSAQGFEFDYVGVIVGRDLRYNFDKQAWEGFPEESFDTVVKRSGPQFLDLVKNSYYVLFTRGMKGCYVHFVDKETERFFRSRLEVA